MKNVFDFSNKVVVIIGGTSGINRGIAEAFARTGAKVAVASRSQEKVDDTVAALKKCGAEIGNHKCRGVRRRTRSIGKRSPRAPYGPAACSGKTHQSIIKTQPGIRN